jgi:hypothetical protein
MPNEWFLVYLAIATVYGIVMYRMGRNAGFAMLIQELVNVGIVKSAEKLDEIIDAHYAAKEEAE